MAAQEEAAVAAEKEAAVAAEEEAAVAAAEAAAEAAEEEAAEEAAEVAEPATDHLLVVMCLSKRPCPTSILLPASPSLTQ